MYFVIELLYNVRFLFLFFAFFTFLIFWFHDLFLYSIVTFYSYTAGQIGKKSVNHMRLRNSVAKDVGNKMPGQFQNFLVCLSNTSTKTTAKDSAETFCILRLQQLQHIIMIWFFNSWDSNGWSERQNFSCWLPCFGFFVCPSYSRRTHYLKLQKPCAHNIAVFENQGKQRKLSNHWKSIKTLLFERNNWGCKKEKRLTGIHFLPKDFMIYKIRYKCLRKTK